MHQVVDNANTVPNVTNSGVKAQTGASIPSYMFKKQEPTFDLHIIAPKARPGSSANALRGSHKQQKPGFDVLRNLK